MSLDLSTVYTILWTVLGAVGIAILLNLYQSLRHSRKNEAVVEEVNVSTGDIPPNSNMKTFLRMFLRVIDRIHLHEATFQKIRQYLDENGMLDKWRKHLNSNSEAKRIQASVYLAKLGGKNDGLLLSERLEVEEDRSTQIHLIYALTQLRFIPALPIILEVAVRAEQLDQARIAGLCYSFGSDFTKLLARRIDNATTEELPFLFEAAKHSMTLELTLLLNQQARTGELPFRHMAAKILREQAPHILRKPAFLKHEDPIIRGLAYESVGLEPSLENLTVLHESLSDIDSQESAIVACSALLRLEPQLLETTIDEFRKTDDSQKRKALAKILSFRIEFFLQSLLHENSSIYRELIQEILEQGEFSAFIAFLNNTFDPELTQTLIELLLELIPTSPGLENELQLYLREDFLVQVNLDRKEYDSKKADPEKERTKFRILLTGLLLALFAFPVGFILTHLPLAQKGEWVMLIQLFIIKFNYTLIYYSVTLNGIYLFITFLSMWGIRKQLQRWRLKSNHFLSRPAMLPSISIIAPAYGEEATIIESTNSLLNLKYPTYKLIVVNDGSPDSTLSTLIEYFDLQKVDIKLDQTLNTMPVRGFYANPNYPKLTVIDKANGGKADSLNVGINASTTDYVCGIDADSLLEPEALTKLASTLMDSPEEGLAAGGNILPINGCKVSRGHLDEIGLPKNSIARFQTVEYLRAFMTGRVGWADLKSLLIISGAFGLFKRDRLLEVGGYLTASGQFHKDTVGEDMELVVRLVRHMHEQRLPHKVHYSFLANCWTEVPESSRILHSQRDRWQRGLLDILTFHRHMVFNPNFKQVGVFALPYFTIFEGLGPLIEVQGYLMVILAAIFGLLNEQIALLLFISSILLGVVNSLLALYAAGLENQTFSFKEKLILIVYAIIENIGFRQIQLFTRLSGYINSLKRPKGWGKMVRKGLGST